jgi:hypothetical protein
MMEPIEKAVDEGGLASAHFPRERDETLTSLDAVHQTGQGFLDLPREEQEARVGVNVERALF